MPWVTEEQIASAKQVDALDYVMTHEPHNIKRSGNNEYRLIDHDSLKFSNGKWHWFSRGFGGKTALDFVIKVRGMDFVDAVLLLTNDARAGPIPVQPVKLPPKAAKEKIKIPFALPKPSPNNDRAIAYLMGRGIDREIIGRCIKAGTLYESITFSPKDNKVYHNCAFVGQDMGGKARFACVRATEGNFRRDMDSSDKRFGFCLPAGKPDSRALMVAEAPIDTLSLATLKKMETAGWDEFHYLSLGGTSPLALIQYLTGHPEIDRITLCLDNDKAGCAATEKIIAAVYEDESLSGRALSFIVEPPLLGKDYNDTLQMVIEEKREYQKQCRQIDRAAISI